MDGTLTELHIRFLDLLKECLDEAVNGRWSEVEQTPKLKK
jgi:hypothetical protein